MATKKKSPAKSADEGFLTAAAQAIGTTLGQLAKKTGVATAPSKPAPKKGAPKKRAARKATAVVKKKPAAKKQK